MANHQSLVAIRAIGSVALREVGFRAAIFLVLFVLCYPWPTSTHAVLLKKPTTGTPPPTGEST